MKHAGYAAGRRPAREQARASERSDGRRSPTTRGTPRGTRLGPWLLDVNDAGDLVAHHDNGTTRVLAQNDGGDQ